ncbi:hypothetical protein [Deinococcus rufus]|uniref:Uncharacterized protein n=1 Tax=Deinococcus rufus TaxID=2136097 RepID=A0ABV7Z851_9DEIO
MTAEMQLRQGATPVPNGTTFLIGEANPGTLTPSVTAELRNTGTAALAGLRLWLVQGTPGGVRVTVAGVPITGTTLATATAVPDLAVGAAHVVIMDGTGPASGRATARLQGVSD